MWFLLNNAKRKFLQASESVKRYLSQYKQNDCFSKCNCQTIFNLLSHNKQIYNNTYTTYLLRMFELPPEAIVHSICGPLRSTHYSFDINFKAAVQQLINFTIVVIIVSVIRRTNMFRFCIKHIVASFNYYCAIARYFIAIYFLVDLTLVLLESQF